MRKNKRVVALFNLSNEDKSININLSVLGCLSDYDATELWTKETTKVSDGTLSQTVAPHGVKIYRLS